MLSVEVFNSSSSTTTEQAQPEMFSPPDTQRHHRHLIPTHLTVRHGTVPPGIFRQLRRRQIIAQHTGTSGFGFGRGGLASVDQHVKDEAD